MENVSAMKNFFSFFFEEEKKKVGVEDEKLFSFVENNQL